MPRQPSATPRARPAADGARESAVVRAVRDLAESAARLEVENARMRAEIERVAGALSRMESLLGGGPRRTRGRARAGPRAAAAVDTAMVAEVLQALGEASASEIAAELSRRGHPVSGRAVRFLAERAGARSVPADGGGPRRYRL